MFWRKETKESLQIKAEGKAAKLKAIEMFMNAATNYPASIAQDAFNLSEEIAQLKCKIKQLGGVAHDEGK